MADMGAKHAPQHVQFVDDHELQPSEETGPLAVVRQDRTMDHFWVGQDRVAAIADPGALFVGRVAVVGRWLDVVDAE